MNSLSDNKQVIKDILKALEGKAIEDGGNTGEGGIELPELNNPATAKDLLYGTQLIDEYGNIVDGEMTNLGPINLTINGTTQTSITIGEGYTSGGTIALDGTIGTEISAQADLNDSKLRLHDNAFRRIIVRLANI